MDMIRLRRTGQIDELLQEEWPGSNWLLSTPKNREVLEDLLLLGLEKFGPDSHWIEELEF